MRAPAVETPAWLRTASEVGWRLLVVIAVVYVVVRMLVAILPVAFPVAIAAILTTLFVPPTRWLEERGLPRTAATSVVVIGGFLLLVGLTALIVSQFIATAPELAEALSQGYEQVLAWLASVGISAEELRSIVEGVIAGDGGDGRIGGIAGTVATGTQAAAVLVGGLLLTLVVLFFFVKDRDQIVRWFRDRTPEGHREVVARLGRRTWEVLSRYVRGVAIVATVDATGTAIGLLIIGVPLVLPLAVLMFLGGFVPVVGALVAGLAATLVALVSGGPVDAALTLAVVVVVQQVDGNILHPIVMGREVQLHPVVVLLAVAIGGILFSIIGAILAVPIAAVASAVGNELRLMNAEDAA